MLPLFPITRGLITKRCKGSMIIFIFLKTEQKFAGTKKIYTFASVLVRLVLILKQT